MAIFGNFGQFWAILGNFWHFLAIFGQFCARLHQQPYFPHCAAEELNNTSQTNSKRRRSSLAQLTELLKEWGVRDKDKYRDKGIY